MKQIGVCDVHKYAKNDEQYREVIYCKTCDSWICDECRPNKLLRAKAASIKLLHSLK